VTLNLFGFGVDVYQTHVGAPDVPVEYAWCIRYNYRTPWHEIDGEDMMGLPMDWRCTRFFYFGWSPVSRGLWTTIHSWLRAI
jgi:hypothetical protein